MKLRPYQARAVAEVRALWSAGRRAVLLVAPTGAGKTLLGEELVSDGGPTLWLAHHRELVQQTATRLARRFGRASVGVIMAGVPPEPKARIQVATVQTVLARWALPPAARLVLDEAHHYLAEEWRLLAEHYRDAERLGLTATPERNDGEPLGDIFDELVVAAPYSELLRDGFLVPARVFQPPVNLGNDIAQDPVDAWARYSEGSQAFVFEPRVDLAYELAQRFRNVGVIAETIEANTARREREKILERFRAGRCRVLTNVNTLTEGVDVPEARTVILARAFVFVGAFLQAVGRVLRPSPGKQDAIVIDLTGATLRHGLPTLDREYSLSGRAISGVTHEHTGSAPPEFTREVRGVELRMAAPGAMVASAEPVELTTIDETVKRAEYGRLLALVRAHGMRDGFAAVKYREKFGEEPRSEWSHGI